MYVPPPGRPIRGWSRGDRFDVGVGRDDDRGGLVQEPETSRLPEHPRAGPAGHRIVAQHQAVPLALQPFQPFGRSGRLVDLVPFHGQGGRQHAPDVFLIFDNEDGPGARFRDSGVRLPTYGGG